MQTLKQIFPLILLVYSSTLSGQQSWAFKPEIIRLDKAVIKSNESSSQQRVTWKTETFVALWINGEKSFNLPLTSLTGNEFIDTIIVDSAKEINGNYYAIISFGHLSTPGYFGPGECGAGWENWLAFIHINPAFMFENFEFYHNQSCAKLIDKQYSFDKSYPERGFVIKSY